jgi:hypothetical protein
MIGTKDYNFSAALCGYTRQEGLSQGNKGMMASGPQVY